MSDYNDWLRLCEKALQQQVRGYIFYEAQIVFYSNEKKLNTNHFEQLETN